jgi:hypothetical protein
MSKGDIITEDSGFIGYTEHTPPAPPGNSKQEDHIMRQIESFLRICSALFAAAGRER